MTAAATSTGNSIQRGSLVVAVLLPLAIASSNQCLYWWFTETTRRDPWQVGVYFLLFVLQVGIVGFIAGRFIPGILSWIVFSWSLFLIDLLTFCMAVSHAHGSIALGPMLGSALVSGQVGAIVVWGILGEQRWAIRVPIAAMLAWTLLLLWRRILDGLLNSTDWYSLLCLQSVLLCALTVVLRGRGCRLMKQAPSGQEDLEANRRKPWQFDLREAFIQTTAIAIAMGVFRVTVSMQRNYSRQFSIQAYIAEIGLAALLATAMLVALWTVFGERKWWVRLSVLVVVLTSIGVLIAWCCEKIYELIVAQKLYYLWDSMSWFIRLKAWWLPWICLATGFLVATLWIFREKGYRLVQTNRKTTSR